MHVPASLLVARHADVLLVGLPRAVVQAAGLFAISNGDLIQSDVRPLSDHCERFGVGAWLPGYTYHSSIDAWECPPIKSGLAKIKNAGLDVGVLIMGRTRSAHPRRRADRASLQGVWPGRPDCDFVFSYGLEDLLDDLLPAAHDTCNTVWNASYPTIRGTVLDMMWDAKVLEKHQQAWCQDSERLLRHHALETSLPAAPEVGAMRF